MTTHSYKVGIEEEYFVIDLESRNAKAAMSRTFFKSAKRILKDRVTTEMLQSQIEIATPPCSSIAEARQQIDEVRAVLGSEARRHNLGIIAASTHPLAQWREQKQTTKVRYDKITTDIQMPGLRTLLCGMHVHVEAPEPERRVELMFRTIPFLPLLLALSTSSPFWEGRSTGLSGYRLAAHDEMPRTGLPELFRTTAEYEFYVSALADGSVVPDASYIWWDIRPSLHNPTLELRIPDVCTRVEDALCVAAIYRCLVRHLHEHPEINADLAAVDRAFAAENRWRAQRYGTEAIFLDRRSGTPTPLATAVDHLIRMLQSDADALDCMPEVRHASGIVKRGSSANDQLRVYRESLLSGGSRTQALKSVVDWLYHTTLSPVTDG
jgi:carboxylate-amine ligase